VRAFDPHDPRFLDKSALIRTTTMRTAFVTWLLFLVPLTYAPPASAEGLDTALPQLQKDGGDGDADHDRAARAADTIWMVSTRHLGCPCADKQPEPAFRFLQYDPASGCQETTWDEWAAAEQPGTTTVVYVHGNRIEGDEALGRGLTAYRSLMRCSPDSPPLRFVIWSWPSSKVHGPRPRRDAQVKAARTDCESYYLASFVSRLNPDTQLSLLGYSFGARIVSGALHLVGGGTLGRFHLSEVNPRPANSVRVVMLVAAMNNNWWLPGCYHEHCFSQVERLLLLYNTCDPVLRYYPRVERRRSAPALGYTGFGGRRSLGEDAWRLEQANVCCQIGKTHDERAYFASETIMRQVRETLLTL
jgi:hypothetical protein